MHVFTLLPFKKGDASPSPGSFCFSPYPLNLFGGGRAKYITPSFRSLIIFDEKSSPGSHVLNLENTCNEEHANIDRCCEVAWEGFSRWVDAYTVIQKRLLGIMIVTPAENGLLYVSQEGVLNTTSSLLLLHRLWKSNILKRLPVYNK